MKEDITKDFDQGGHATHIEDNWYINYDEETFFKYFLYHYCRDKFILATQVNDSNKEFRCYMCDVRPPAAVIGYYNLCVYARGNV